MIHILRLSHRKERDKRVSTHAGLVARALGADKIIFSGEEDMTLINSINKVSKSWGGSFKAEYSKDYRQVILQHKEKGFLLVHLTMYGLELEKTIEAVRKSKDILLIIGGEKVSRDVYEAADYNVSVTNQPHSEIAALALTLDRYFKGRELAAVFDNAEKKIKPNPKGKSFQ